MQAAIDHGPHQSVLQPEAIQHFNKEIQDKIARGQAGVIYGTISKMTLCVS
jgi:hypothetical protein